MFEQQPLEVDPSTVDGSKCVFDQLVSLELRSMEADDQVGKLVPLRTKVFVLSDADSRVSRVRIELR